MAERSNYGPLDSPEGYESDVFFMRMNTRMRPDQLRPGDVALSINGRMDVDGAWQPRKPINHFGPTIGSGVSALTLPFYLYASRAISSATRLAATVTVTTSTAHGFLSGTQVGIGGLTGTVDPNGNRTVTVTGPTTFTFDIPGAVGSETYSGSGTAGAPYLLGTANLAYGSCLFSDPSDNNDEYIIIAQHDNAVAVDLVSGSATTIAYPSGITIDEPVNMMQAFEKVYLFRTGATALEWNGGFSGTPTFVKVANGTYTQPSVFTSANNTSCTSGVVTVTEASHGLSVGDTVVIMDPGSSPLAAGDEYKVATVPGSGTFTFYANVDNFAATSVVLGQRQSQGKGYTHMPAPPWGVYHQRRLWVPFQYTTTGPSGSETITARNISDEVIASDIGDPTTYDQLVNVFRVTNGTADYLQTLHPFAEDNIIAFNRNSIHLISGVSGRIDDASTRLITAEVGLLARRSVVTIGNRIFFLSDNGVYAIEFGDLYNLRGAGLPLSAPIDSLIKRINPEYAENAVAAFHNNRYWLAVPLDSSTNNNAILVYNVLNEGWESLDLVSSQQWDIRNLIVAGAGGVNKLYAINVNGGLHILDEREDDTDLLQLYPGVDATSYPVSASVTTRSYTLGVTGRKKFTEFEVHVESSESNASNGTLTAESENLDSSISLGTISSLYGSALPVAEDASLRGRIGGVRAYGLQLTFTPTAGRPKLRMARVNGVNSFRQTTSAT